MRMDFNLTYESRRSAVIRNDNMSKIRPHGQLLTTVDSNVSALAKVALDYFFKKSWDKLPIKKIL